MDPLLAGGEEPLNGQRVLVLNRGYLPTNLVGWKQALILVFLEKAEVLRAYGRRIRSVRSAYPMPSVIRLTSFGGNPFVVPKFSRRNVYVRDDLTCQYCGRRPEVSQLNLDHVVPISRGGKTRWDNVVCCCKPCNRRKGDRTPAEAGMKLLRAVRTPQNSLLLRLRGTRFPDSWRDFLYFSDLKETAS
jgi:5-methylcytosine-specific restriction endonuclease McrA